MWVLKKFEQGVLEQGQILEINCQVISVDLGKDDLSNIELLAHSSDPFLSMFEQCFNLYCFVPNLGIPKNV